MLEDRQERAVHTAVMDARTRVQVLRDPSAPRSNTSPCELHARISAWMNSYCNLAHSRWGIEVGIGYQPAQCALLSPCYYPSSPTFWVTSRISILEPPIAPLSVMHSKSQHNPNTHRFQGLQSISVSIMIMESSVPTAQVNSKTSWLASGYRG